MRGCWAVEFPPCRGFLVEDVARVVVGGVFEWVVCAYLVGIDERPVLVFEWRDVFEVCRLVVLGVAVDVIDFVAVGSRAYPCGGD